MRQWQPPAGVIKPYRIVFEMGLKNDPARSRSQKSSFLDRKGEQLGDRQQSLFNQINEMISKVGQENP